VPATYEAGKRTRNKNEKGGRRKLAKGRGEEGREKK
jgi:hypothetical protein